MSLPMMLAAGAILLILIALLVLQRRRATTTPEDADTPADAPEKTSPESTASRQGPDADRWRPLGAGDRVQAIVRGRHHGLRLLRDPSVTILRAIDDDTVRVVHTHDDAYGGRPNWEHITALTLVMARAERCWPGADPDGLLQYTDTAVPVAYSPRLVADLEDATAPDPEGATPA